MNTGRRGVIDVEVIAQLNVKGLHHNRPEIWEIAYLHLDGSRFPLLSPQKGRMIFLEAEKTPRFALSAYGDGVRERLAEGACELIDLLSLGSDAWIRVFVFGYDELSGARKMFASRHYRRENVLDGTFDDAMNIVPERQ